VIRITSAKPDAIQEAINSEFDSKRVYTNDLSLIQHIYSIFTNGSSADCEKELAVLKNSIARTCYNTYEKITKLIYGVKQYKEYIAANKVPRAPKRLSVTVPTPIVEQSVSHNPISMRRTLHDGPSESVLNRNTSVSISQTTTACDSAHRHNKNQTKDNMAPLVADDDEDYERNQNKAKYPSSRDGLEVRSDNSESSDEDDADEYGPRVNCGILGSSLLGKSTKICGLNYIVCFIIFIRCAPVHAVQ
jgi:hypothetical protein